MKMATAIKETNQSQTGKKMSNEERQRRAFSRRLKKIFTAIGFDYLPSELKEFKIGDRKAELDFVLLYENLVVIGEETTISTKSTHHHEVILNHIRTKNESFEQIENNKSKFITWLKRKFPEFSQAVDHYGAQRMHFYYLYCTKERTGIDENRKHESFPLIKFVEPETINYFQRMSDCLQNTEMYDFLNFLGVTDSELGKVQNTTTSHKIQNSIITPDDGTGLPDGVRVVSFMMSAEDLLKTAYVLRKDDWNNASWYYQRLIKPTRIKSIRKYISSTKSTFINNIIVALPQNVRFTDECNNPVDIFSCDKFTDLSVEIPFSMNSICVIDGQHRIFAHYHGKDKYEKTIAELRTSRHLLVTGLVFPTGMSEKKQLQIQSKIFLDINQNTEKVPKDVILQIKRTADPLSDTSIATQVLEEMNRESPFKDLFQFSGLRDEKRRIRTSSIISYGLRKLVSKDTEGISLYSLWRERDDTGNDGVNMDNLDCYVSFCAKHLSLYFRSVFAKFRAQWNDEKSQIRSVASINGFLIAFDMLLSEVGLPPLQSGYDFYTKLFSCLQVDFSVSNFPYRSSQYHRFAKEIVRQVHESSDFSEIAKSIK